MSNKVYWFQFITTRTIEVEGEDEDTARRKAERQLHMDDDILSCTVFKEEDCCDA